MSQPPQRSVILTLTDFPWSKKEKKLIIFSNSGKIEGEWRTVDEDLFAADGVVVRVGTVIATKVRQ